MVFSSHPLYQLDPPNWQDHQHQQQQMILYGGGDENSTSDNTPQHLPLQLQPSAATGGSRNIRPGSMTVWARMAKVPLPETALKCPRCESTNTKFCYFNNYSLTQPRHFCKTCRRYWTRGGALRNVPVGGGCRRATKRSSKKRSKSPAVSGTATVTTTITSTDQNNGNNMIDDVVLQFPFYPQGGMNQMVHEFGGRYIGGGNNYGGAQTDPHIARLFQTGVVSLADTSNMDHQWSRLAEKTLTQVHSPSFPLLMAQQEHSSQSSGLLYQFGHQCGDQLGLIGSSLVNSLGYSNCNAVNMSIMDRTVANVKMEDGKIGSRISQGMRVQGAVSNNSMPNGNSEFSMVGNRIGHTWTDVLGFTSNEPTTGQKVCDQEE